MLLKASGAYLGVPTKSGQRRGGSASGALTSPPPVSRRIINAAPFVVLHIICQNENPAQGVEATRGLGNPHGTYNFGRTVVVGESSTRRKRPAQTQLEGGPLEL
jgi:hypothetical protein